MKAESIAQLLEKLETGEITSKEKLALKLAIHKYNMSEPTGLSDDDFQHARVDMLKAINKARYPKNKKISLWKSISIAASFIMISGLGLYVYVSNHRSKNTQEVKNDVQPGKNASTLVLENGQRILISEKLVGKIAKLNGVNITKLSNGEIIYEITSNTVDKPGLNTLSTANGQQSQVRLPDGTLVFLNSASSIKYPTSFHSTKKRIIELDGEAYFEVAKDKVHPFVVKTIKQEVEVLGTHFNINCYKDEKAIKTTLLEGAVKVKTGLTTSILKPNQQFVLTNNEATINEVDTEEVISWKNSEFIFRGEDFRTNMRKISRWYDVEIIYGEDAPDNFNIGGFSSKSRNLSVILKMLEKTEKVHFRIDGRKVYVNK